MYFLFDLVQCLCYYLDWFLLRAQLSYFSLVWGSLYLCVVWFELVFSLVPLISLSYFLGVLSLCSIEEFLVLYHFVFFCFVLRVAFTIIFSVLPLWLDGAFLFLFLLGYCCCDAIIFVFVRCFFFFVFFCFCFYCVIKKVCFQFSLGDISFAEFCDVLYEVQRELRLLYQTDRMSSW